MLFQMDKINTVRMTNVEGCKTIQDVHAFINKHLKNRCNQPSEMIQDEEWTIVSGFRIDLHCHNIYVNNSTNEYAVHDSAVNLYEHHNIGFPNFGRYNTYSDMRIGFVNKYAELWQIGQGAESLQQLNQEVKDRMILDEQIEALEAQYAAHRMICNDWEHHVHEDFNGYGCFAILSMYSYHLNVARGFGSCNDESVYQSRVAKDKDGTRLEAAMHWVKLSLESSNIRAQIFELKKQRGDFTRNIRKKPSAKS